MATSPGDVLADDHRLRLLHRAGVLDSPPEEAFDRLTRLAAAFTEVPVSLVSFVDPERQFFKSCYGEIAEPYHSDRETPLSHSFCQHVVQRSEPLIINDARDHPLVRDNLAVPDLGVVAYAGIPIVTPDGAVLGSFCAIDTEPREWTEEEIAVLEDLAGSVNTEIALRLELAEEKELKEELRDARDEAQAATRAKSEFLANMSHEIRTPMNAVVGMTDLVLDMELQPESRSYLETVRSSADSLLRIINDILDFSRMEAGRLELDPTSFGLRDLLADVLRALSVKANEKGLELAFDVEPDVPDHLVGDTGRLRQILTNLVGNAVKFTDDGEVVVRASRAEEAAEDDGLQLHLSVEDTGVGISPDKLDAIFESFTQEDASTTRRYGGTGLGLAITRQLTALMGGTVWAESEPGVGSVFHVTVHVEQAGGEAPRPAEPEVADGLRVLVVDDNRTNRVILTETLGRWGGRVISVSGGAAALETIQDRGAGGLDVVILDQDMPDMDGLSVAEAIHDLEEGLRPAVVMLSSAAVPGDARRARSHGVVRFLMKPARQSELLDALAVASGRGGHAAAAGRSEHDGEGSPRRPLSVLVAEDNPVNQRVAQGILAKRDHRVTVVEDGRKAVEAWEAGDFDVILMDVQMPVMDGLEATRAIRAREDETDRRPTPVIALTAHVMSGDRARCMEAGMDHYLAKPLRAEDLLDLLDRPALQGRGAGSASEGTEGEDPEAEDAEPQDSEDTSELPSRDALLDAVGGDPKLLLEIIEVWMEEGGAMVEEVRLAVEAGDPERLRSAAHKLKGAVSAFRFEAMVQGARTLEEKGADEELSGAAGLVEELAGADERLSSYLESLRPSLREG